MSLRVVTHTPSFSEMYFMNLRRLSDLPGFPTILLCIGIVIILPPSRYKQSKASLRYCSYVAPAELTKPGLMWNFPSLPGECYQYPPLQLKSMNTYSHSYTVPSAYLPSHCPEAASPTAGQSNTASPRCRLRMCTATYGPSPST